MLVIGLMSGTSADGIDAALVEWPDGPAVHPFRLRAYREEPLEEELRSRIHQLAAGRLPGEKVLAEFAALDALLGARFGAAALRVAEQAGVKSEAIAAIASHGQTVAHHPEVQSSLQIGDPSRIAEVSGMHTIADFRARDLAAGGEGAPLAPFFHWAVLRDVSESRLVLNLGGIANLTWLPAGASAEEVLAFDTGPANTLVDGVLAVASGGRESMDRDGGRAARGAVDEALLDTLLDDAFLRRSPPKSTGRERYGLAEAERLYADSQSAGRSLDDLVATLTVFCAETIARAVRDFLPGTPDRLYVCGGGARNPVLMAAIAERIKRGAPALRVGPIDEAGVPGDATEAMAFSLMGRNTLLGLPNHLPQCTGARAARVLGESVKA